MLELETKPMLKLGLISRLFEVLNRRQIVYCHWKSKEDLQACMEGDTDLNILFDREEKGKIESALEEVGFKKFAAIGHTCHSDIADYLALDADSGRVIHLHTHYRLPIGKASLKEVQFNSDIEKEVLKSRVFNEDYGIFCIQPATAFVLLYIREALELRIRDVISVNFQNKSYHNASALREYSWLKERVTEQEVKLILKTTFRDHPEVRPFITGEFSTKQLYRLASAIRKGRKFKSLHSTFAACMTRWYRQTSLVWALKASFLLARPVPFKRTNPRGGRVVAVIGADGSGKSTVVENLKNTFEGKLDVYQIYFGRGDGKASRPRKILNSIKALFKPEKRKKTQSGEKSSSAVRKRGFVRSLHKCAEALLVAAEKKNHLTSMNLARKRGMLVICDRYPQNQIMGYNDGPLLHDWLNSGNILLRSLAKWECAVYSSLERQPPDVVFKLIADADVVEKRKPGETSLERLTSKINGIRQLEFKHPCKVVAVDATKPLAEVLYLVKKEIWSML